MSETPQQAARRLAAMAISEGFKPEALHEYRDPGGTPIYWRLRAKHPDGRKWIRPMRLDGKGYEIGEPEFLTGKPLYRLRDLIARPDDLAWFVEGELCADALAQLDILATTSGAADSAKRADFSPLASRRVNVWPDNDAPGLRQTQEVADKLVDLGSSVRLVDVGKLDLPPKGDVVDWLKAHHGATRSDLEALPMVDYAQAATDKASSLANMAMGSVEDCISYRRASDIQARPIRWLWQGRFARGKVSLLAGNPGLGKSQLAASMASIVSTGGPWPVDRTSCEQGAVVILSAEDDAEDTIKPRLEAAGADLSRVYILDGMVRHADGSGRALSLQQDLDRLSVTLTDIGDVALVVIDPITAYLGDADSHRNAEIRALLAPLSDLAAKHETAVICVSHLNKSGGTEAMLRVTGSLAFVAASRAAFLVAKDKENGARRLFLPMKNNIGNDSTGLAFELRSAQVASPAGVIDTCHVVWHSEVVTMTADEAMQPTDERRFERNAAAEWLRDALADGPRSAKALRGMAADAGFTWATLRRAKDALGIKPTKTRFDGGWEWALPPKMLTKTHEDAHTPTGEHLRRENGQKAQWNAAFSEDAHVSTFEGAHPCQDAHEDAHPEHLRQNPQSSAISGVKSYEDAQAKTVSTFGDSEHLREDSVDDAEYEVEV
jgi:hypothetical protein